MTGVGLLSSTGVGLLGLGRTGVDRSVRRGGDAAVELRVGVATPEPDPRPEREGCGRPGRQPRAAIWLAGPEVSAQREAEAGEARI